MKTKNQKSNSKHKTYTCITKASELQKWTKNQKNNYQTADVVTINLAQLLAYTDKHPRIPGRNYI